MCEYSSARAKCTPQESHNNVENACHRKASNAGSTKWNKTGQAIIWQFKQIMHVVTFTWGRQSEMQTGWNTNDLRSTLAKNWSHLTRWMFCESLVLAKATSPIRSWARFDVAEYCSLNFGTLGRGPPQCFAVPLSMMMMITESLQQSGKGYFPDICTMKLVSTLFNTSVYQDCRQLQILYKVRQGMLCLQCFQHSIIWESCAPISWWGGLRNVM